MLVLLLVLLLLVLLLPPLLLACCLLSACCCLLPAATAMSALQVQFLKTDDDAEWELSWCDEFDGDTVNVSKWRVADGGTHGDELELYSKEAVYLLFLRGTVDRDYTTVPLRNSRTQIRPIIRRLITPGCFSYG